MMRFVPVAVLSCVALHASVAFAAKENKVGKVVSVKSGDRFRLEAGDQIYEVRIQGIDAPERGQPHFEEARDRLSDLILDKTVRVHVTRQRHDHLDGLVYDGTHKISDTMLAEGLAWRYFHTAGTTSFSKLEQLARVRKKGLWGGEDPTPPWIYRRDNPQVEDEEDLEGLPEAPTRELAELQARLLEEQRSEATLRVAMHRSRLIRTRQPIIRFTVTRPDVLQVVQVSPNEFELIGQQPGLTTFNVWFVDPATGRETTLRYVVRITDQDVREE